MPEIEAIAAEPTSAPLESPSTERAEPRELGARREEPDRTATETGDEPEGGARAAEPQRRPGVPPEVRAHIKALRAENPALAEHIERAFGQQAALLKAAPGGLKEVRDLKAFADQVGGPDGVRALNERVGEIVELDRMWEASDPRAVDTMAEDYPQQFSAMMPHAVGLWADRSPEEFQRLACGIVAQTFAQQAEGGYSPLNLLWMAQQSLQVGNAEQAAQMLGELERWARGFSAAATRKPEAAAPDQSSARVAELERRLQQQTSQHFDGAVARDVESHTERIVDAALAPHLGGRRPTEGQSEALRARAIDNIARAMEADGRFMANVGAFKAAGDQAGLIRIARQKVEALAPGCAKQAARWLFGQPAAAKPATVGASPAVTPRVGISAPAAPVPLTGRPWTRVSRPPKPATVDTGRSPFAMRMANSAVLKDGRRVYWGESPYRQK